MTQTTKEQQKQIQSFVMEIVNSIKNVEQSEASYYILKVFKRHCFRKTETTLPMIHAILNSSEETEKQIQNKISLSMIAIRRFRHPQIWVSVASEINNGFINPAVSDMLSIFFCILFIIFFLNVSYFDLL